MHCEIHKQAARLSFPSKRQETMKKTLIAVTAALGIQFLLLHSHKLGSMHWAWVSGGSLTLFVLLYGVITARHSTTGMNSLLAAGGVLCVLVPPAIYLTADWLQAPSHVVNAIFQGGPLFLVSIVFVSGGWLFALAFLLSQRWRSCSRT